MKITLFRRLIFAPGGEIYVLLDTCFGGAFRTKARRLNEAFTREEAAGK